MPFKDSAARRLHFRNRTKNDVEFRAKHCERNKLYYKTHKKEYAAAGRKRNASVKLEAIQYYGQVCFCCGEDVLDFLALDHKEGGGNAERKKSGTAGGVQFYKWLKRKGWPEGYQVACHNCNMGRHFNGGLCPHQRESMKRVGLGEGAGPSLKEVQ